MDVDTNSLLSHIRMKDINAFYANRLQAKFSRKNDALQFASEQPDSKEMIATALPIDNFYEVVPPEGICKEDALKSYAFSREAARIIGDTYKEGCRTLYTIGESRKRGFKNRWTIGSPCSESCKIHDVVTSSLPKELPPYHMGCACRLTPADGVCFY